MTSIPFLQADRALSLSGTIRYLSGRETAVLPAHVLSCSASVGVRDGMLPGAVLARQCTLLLHNKDRLFTSGLDPVGAWVQLQVHAQDEALPLTAFYVTAASQPDGSEFITLSGQDALGLYFDRPFQDDLSYPVSLKTLAESILQKAGFQENLSFPCMAHQVPVMPEWGDVSLRGALAFVAQACGCFAMADPQGHIGLYPAFDAAQMPYEIFPENTFSCSGGDITFGPVNGVRIALHGAEKGDSPLEILMDDAPDGHTDSLSIARNPLLMKDQPFARMLATDMLSGLAGMQLTRLRLSWRGDPSVRLGQRIRVHHTDGGFTDTCITALSFAADHGFTMQTDCTLQKKTSSAGRVFTPSGGLNGALLDGEVNGALLKTESVTARKIAASAITTEKLDAGCVTAEKVAASSIATGHLQAGSISSDKLQSGSITTEKLAAGAVTADKIAGKSITAEQLQAGLITAQSGLIGDSAIGTAQIADGSITDAKIVGLTASKITAGTLDAADVNVINLKADNITTGTLNGKVIPQLGSDKIADGAVSGVKIVNGAVSTDKISDAAVTAAKIVSSAVTTDKLAANAVTANKILSGAVTTDKLSANAVTADKLAAQSVTANKLASDVGSSLDLSSNNSVKLMVDNVQVGGTNLYPDTRLMGEEIWRLASSRVKDIGREGVDEDGYMVIRAEESTGENYNPTCRPYTAHQPLYAALKGKQITFSLEIDTTATSINIEHRIMHTEDVYKKYFITYLPLSGQPGWQRVSETFTLTDDLFDTGSGDMEEGDTFVIITKPHQTPVYRLRKIKMEIGNKATDWSPAPQDGAYSASAVLDRSGIHLKTGGTFTVDSQNFDVDGDGKMTAKAGSIGGWSIAPGNLSSGSGTKHVRLSTEDATYAIWAGAESGGSAPFRVTRDGNVYLTKLFVTDENGNAQASPVNLSGSWWRTNRAVRSMEVEGNTLTITLYDGTSVNFKKAAVSDAEIGGYNLENATILVVVYDENGEAVLEEALPDGGLMEEVYGTGWNECIDNCSYQSEVYTISEHQPASPLYMKVGDSYTSVGTGWVRTARATGMYRIPGKKT
ncbi:MAG: hypothetical protein IKM64_05785 [Clostridia bacterium]|nr:hypothetical protein [Clostridia bacterium]